MVGPGGFAPGFVLTAGLDIGRYSVACGSVGIIQACLEATAGYARARHVGGTAIGDFQLIQAKLADMVTAAARAARCANGGPAQGSGRRGDGHGDLGGQVLRFPRRGKAAADAVQVHGANGCTDAYR